MSRPKPAYLAAAIFVFASLEGGLAYAQADRPDFSGVWSDPPPTLEDQICFNFCTEWGADYFLSLLDDPANDERPFLALWNDTMVKEMDGYFRPRLTDAALETFPIDPADDPGFRECRPWGFARQFLAPHQLQIAQFDDRVEFHYGEWDARRTIYLAGYEPDTDAPASLLGFSVGRYEGDTLVVETSRVTADITFWWAQHSDQLKTIERYRVSDDRERLVLDVTMTDPWGIKEPLELWKVWSWAPDEEIFPYENCERPTEFTRGAAQP